MVLNSKMPGQRPCGIKLKLIHTRWIRLVRVRHDVAIKSILLQIDRLQNWQKIEKWFANCCDTSTR